MAIDRALELQPTQLSDDDFKNAVESVKNTDDWKHVFSESRK